ncbi:MAG: ribosomal-processing cysteine protease Prp [Clostridiales bacterium]|nr:ribosomal-processing cysteine protease Prp [Clostridiales bacterium]
MVEVNFFTRENLLYGYEIKGHSGFDVAGSDIVCASVSSVSIMVANTITDVMKITADAESYDGFLRLEVLTEDGIQESQNILKGLEVFLTDLSREYPKNVKVKYGGVRNA